MSLCVDVSTFLLMDITQLRSGSIVRGRDADTTSTRERQRRRRLRILFVVLVTPLAWVWYRIVTGNPIKFGIPRVVAESPEIWISVGLMLFLCLLIGIPLLGALLVCYVGGIVSAFASSAAVLGATIPLAVPFLMQGHLSAAGVICAAVSSTIVDVSPFSTNGALVVASAAKEERETLFRRFLVYSGLVVALGPLLAWLVFVVPGWM